MPHVAEYQPFSIKNKTINNEQFFKKARFIACHRNQGNIRRRIEEVAVIFQKRNPGIPIMFRRFGNIEYPSVT